MASARRCAVERGDGIQELLHALPGAGEEVPPDVAHELAPGVAALSSQREAQWYGQRLCRWPASTLDSLHNLLVQAEVVVGKVTRGLERPRDLLDVGHLLRGRVSRVRMPDLPPSTRSSTQSAQAPPLGSSGGRGSSAHPSAGRGEPKPSVDGVEALAAQGLDDGAAVLDMPPPLGGPAQGDGVLPPPQPGLTR